MAGYVVTKRKLKDELHYTQSTIRFFERCAYVYRQKSKSLGQALRELDKTKKRRKKVVD